MSSIAKRKPKNARSKRAMKERDPKMIEGDRGALFMRGTSTNELITEILKDLHDLKKPNSTYFPRRNEKRPFEDETSAEFLCEKNEASLFGFGSHSKKRPNNLILGRLFNYKIFDMHELALTNVKPANQFKPSKQVSFLNRPIVSFQGDAFESDAKFAQIKSLFLDMFQHASLGKVNLAGLEHTIVLTAKGDKVSFRHYAVHLKKSGEKVPKVTLEELGPRFDMEVRRSREASTEVAREAMRVSKLEKGVKLRKNLERNNLGDTTGRVHMQSQTFEDFQTRKMLGLKRGRDKVVEAERDKQERAKQARLEAGADSA